MGEIAINLLKWTFRIAFIGAVVLAIIAILSIITNYLIIGFNQSVLADIFSLIQIWLPFNLNIVLLWITIAGTAYLAYKTAIMSYVLLNTFLGKN